MWRYEEDIVRSTTREEILQGVNRLVKSPWYGHATDFTKLLGGVERDKRGEIRSAKTALMVWTLRWVRITFMLHAREIFRNFNHLTIVIINCQTLDFNRLRGFVFILVFAQNPFLNNTKCVMLSECPMTWS